MTDRQTSDKEPGAFRTISEVAAELDVPQHVLRFWETRFSQIRPLKRGGGRRFYRPEDVLLIQGIRHLLYGEGYTIKGVQRILKEEGVRYVQQIGAGVNEIEGAALAMDETSVAGLRHPQGSSHAPGYGYGQGEGAATLAARPPESGMAPPAAATGHGMRAIAHEAGSDSERRVSPRSTAWEQAADDGAGAEPDWAQPDADIPVREMAAGDASMGAEAGSQHWPEAMTAGGGMSPAAAVESGMDMSAPAHGADDGRAERPAAAQWLAMAPGEAPGEAPAALSAGRMRMLREALAELQECRRLLAHARSEGAGAD